MIRVVGRDAHSQRPNVQAEQQQNPPPPPRSPVSFHAVHQQLVGQQQQLSGVWARLARRRRRRSEPGPRRRPRVSSTGRSFSIFGLQRRRLFPLDTDHRRSAFSLDPPSRRQDQERLDDDTTTTVAARRLLARSWAGVDPRPQPHHPSRRHRNGRARRRQPHGCHRDQHRHQRRYDAPRALPRGRELRQPFVSDVLCGSLRGTVAEPRGAGCNALWALRPHTGPCRSAAVAVVVFDTGAVRLFLRQPPPYPGPIGGELREDPQSRDRHQH